VITLLRVLGVTPVSTDLLLWDRERKQAREREQEREATEKVAGKGTK
jgi:hypothetical protein